MKVYTNIYKVQVSSYCIYIVCPSILTWYVVIYLPNAFHAYGHLLIYDLTGTYAMMHLYIERYK